MTALSTIQIAAAGLSLVRSRLRLQGIETDEAEQRSVHHLVIRSPAHLAGRTIRVQANAEPKPGGGKGRLTLAWMLPDRYRGDFVAVADLSSGRVWLFDTADAFARAQQHPKDRHHLIMIVDGAGFRGSKHSEILAEHFRDNLLEIRAASMLKAGPERSDVTLPSIRPLAPSDPPVIAAAFAAIGWAKPRAQYERYLAEQETGERHVWVAYVGSEFAGYVTLTWEPDYPPFRAEGIPEIQDFNVLPAFRRRGIGSALMDAAESAAGERTRIVGIGVGLDPGYGPAQRLYVRRGYVPDGRGIAWHNSTVSYGEQVLVDDYLVLYFTRELGG